MSRIPDHELEKIRRSLPLSDVVVRVAGVTWDRKKSVPGRRDWWACCPFHGEKSASFHCDDRKGFYKCFGCGASGDVFGFVKNREGLSFAGAVERVAALAGLPSPVNAPDAARQPDPAAAARIERQREAADKARERRQQRDDERRIGLAREVWKAGAPAAGTLVETYLKNRGFPLSPPESLRFAAALEHKPSGRTLPAMLGCMQGADGRLTGVHRTYLAPDGAGKADVTPNKMMLGVAAGACVRLTPAAAHLYLAEGIETSLRVLQLKPGAHVWAALSLGNLGTAWLPDAVRQVTIVADNDQKDWRAGKRAVNTAVAAHAAAGRQVNVVWPPRGMDFDDWGRQGAA